MPKYINLGTTHRRVVVREVEGAVIVTVAITRRPRMEFRAYGPTLAVALENLRKGISTFVEMHTREVK